MKTELPFEACCDAGWFDGSQNSIENGGQMVSQIIKSRSRGLLGRILLILAEASQQYASNKSSVTAVILLLLYVQKRVFQF